MILFLPREQEIHIFKLTCKFFLLYRRTNHGVIGDFPKVSDDCPKFARRSHERCRTFSEHFTEGCRRLLKSFREDPKIFRSYTSEFKYNLRDKLDISESIDILVTTSEDMENTPPESRTWFRMNFKSGAFSSKTLVSI